MTDDREREEEEKAKETYHKEDRRPGRMIDPDPEVVESDALPEDEALPEVEMPEEYAADGAAGMPQIDVYGLLRMVLGMCADQAWVQMGLQLAPGAKEIKADLKQARVAIDTVNFIKDALGDNLTAEERREVEQLVATLRMNYVQRA
ncbi:MAG: DUF1844 domain-containing protein [Armatimonadota bacterium]